MDMTEVSSLPLKAGHAGLTEHITQAEGVTMDGDRNIYICSEPNR
jgi:uncharacterized protein YjiK